MGWVSLILLHWVRLQKWVTVSYSPSFWRICPAICADSHSCFTGRVLQMRHYVSPLQFYSVWASGSVCLVDTVSCNSAALLWEAQAIERGTRKKASWAPTQQYQWPTTWVSHPGRPGLRALGGHLAETVKETLMKTHNAGPGQLKNPKK